MKYLGVSLRPGKMTKTDCAILIKKIVGKTGSWGTRKLSYGGKVQLVG